MGHNGPEETTYTKQGFGQHIEVITVNGWFAGEMGEGESREMGRWVSSQWGRQVKTSNQTFSNFLLNTVTEGAVTTEAGNQDQAF